MRLKLIGIIALSYILTSCEFVERVFYSDEIVARVGKSVLYRKDLAGLVSAGMNATDSLEIVTKYINGWYKDERLVQMAERELSEEALDVSKELESYRKALLIYRYEQMYVSGRLDTVVTDIELEEYYASHQHVFLADSPLVRGFLLTIRGSSPNINKIRTQMRALKETDTEKMRSLAAMVGYGHRNFYDYWLSLKSIALDYNLVLDDLDNKVRSGAMVELENDGMVLMMKVWDMIPEGEIMPLDYCADLVKESILTGRKSQLLNNLEQELLKQ